MKTFKRFVEANATHTHTKESHRWTAERDLKLKLNSHWISSFFGRKSTHSDSNWRSWGAIFERTMVVILYECFFSVYTSWIRERPKKCWSYPRYLVAYDCEFGEPTLHRLESYIMLIFSMLPNVLKPLTRSYYQFRNCIYLRAEKCAHFAQNKREKIRPTSSRRLKIQKHHFLLRFQFDSSYLLFISGRNPFQADARGRMAIDIMTLCLHEKIERNLCNYVIHNMYILFAIIE